MSFIEQLNEKFPIRRSKEQKAAFRAWFMQQAEELGYSARVEENNGHLNVVVGDPETASAIFTAHYDTPAASFLPNVMTPRNKVFFWAYQMLQVGILVALGCAVGVPLAVISGDDYTGFLAGYAVYMGCLALMIFGPANKHNVNDNTSGVAAVLETMARIPEENRSKTAFILFDNEEKGCRGSGAYAKAHPQVKENGFLVNLDCVGDGDEIVMFPTKAMKQDTAKMDALRKITGAFGTKSIAIRDSGFSYYPSDQKQFPYGVGIAALRRSKRAGLYLSRIHTKKDTILEETNVNILRAAIVSLITCHAAN